MNGYIRLTIAKVFLPIAIGQYALMHSHMKAEAALDAAEDAEDRAVREEECDSVRDHNARAIPLVWMGSICKCLPLLLPSPLPLFFPPLFPFLLLFFFP
jgi:hypothetical protein